MALVDDVLRVITTYLGLQGDVGTPLHVLWEHLTTEGPFQGLPELPNGVKDAAWDALRSDPDAFVLSCPQETAQVTGKTEAYVDDDVQKTYAEEQANVRQLTAKKKNFKRPPPSALTGFEVKGFLVLAVARATLARDAAESAGVQVIMTKHLRQVALDVRTAEVTPARCTALSPVAMASLERIARSRTSGILRSELPKQLGVKQSNFHYVMKQLLSRSLVKATPIKFTRNRTCISTAALHLTRFAPEISLASCQALTTPDGDTNAVRIDDEACLLLEMCAKLASLPGQTVPVFEFKKFYGLQNVQGHRLWRKMRTKLMKDGCAECYDGVVHEKVMVHMIRLLKPWNPDDTSGGSSEWPLTAPYDAVLPRNLPALRAMLEALVGSGAAGVSSEEMMDLFHITSKAASLLIRPFIEHYGVESHRENGLKNKRALVYRYFATKDVRAVVLPLLRDQSHAHIPSSSRIDAGAGGAGATLSSAAAAVLAPSEPPEAGGTGDADVPVADAEEGAADGLARARSCDGDEASPSRSGDAGDEGGGGAAPKPKVKMNLNLVRQLRQDIIKERLQEAKIILRSEVRYLWHTYAAERKLPSELGAADPKTVGRLMKIMHEKKLASDGIVVNIPPAKSSLGFCQPREVVVYTAYDSKIPMQELEAMARAHSVIVDRRLRSRQYVDRNTKKSKSAKAREGPVLEHVGQLIPDVRDRVDAALKTSKTYRRAMRSPAAFPSNHSVDEGDGNARPQSPGSRGQAALDSTPDGSAPPQPLSLRENDQRSIHMPEVAREFFSQGSGAFCGADAPLPPAARERLFRVSLVGRAWTREKRARSPKASERGAVKHLRLQFGTKAFSGYISAIRASGCLLVKAWRMRALHFHLVQLVGLQGGGPMPSLALAQARPIPKHLLSRAIRLTRVDRGAPVAEPAAAAPAPVGDVAPEDVVLSPLIVLMSAPVCVIMQLVGSTTSPSGDGTDESCDAMHDDRVSASLSDAELEGLLDDGCIRRMLTLLTNLANMGLLTHSFAPGRSVAIDVAPAAAAGHNFRLATRVEFESPKPADDPFRDAMIQAHEAGGGAVCRTEVAVAVARSEYTASEAFAELLQHEGGGGQLAMAAGVAADVQPASGPSAEGPAATGATADVRSAAGVRADEPSAAGAAADVPPACGATAGGKPASGATVEASAAPASTSPLDDVEMSAAPAADDPACPQPEPEPSTVAPAAADAPTITAQKPQRKREKTVAELLTPDPRIHTVESVHTSTTNNWYVLTYDVSTWGGWIGFWDHCAFIRASPDLATLCSGTKPFSKVGKEYLVATRGSLASTLLHAGRALAAERKARGNAKALPIAATRRALSRIGLSLAEAAVVRRMAARAEKYAPKCAPGGARPHSGRLGRLQTGIPRPASASRPTSASVLRKKQRAAKSADAPAAARKAAAGKAASAAPPGPDGLGVTVASPAGDQGGPPVKRRRARRPVRKQRGKIGCMVHGAYIETEIYDSDESEGGYDVLMQRRAIRRSMESVEADLSLVKPGAFTGSKRDRRGAAGAVIIRHSGLITKAEFVGETVTLRTGAVRRRADEEASDSETEEVEEEDEEPEADWHIPGQGKAIEGQLRGRPKRWPGPEEKALLTAIVRVTVIAGPDLNHTMVPWGQFAGIRHTTSACTRRISFYRLVNAPNDKALPELPPGKRRRKADLSKDNQFYQLCSVAAEVYRLRQRRRVEAVRAALTAKLTELSAVRGPGGDVSEPWSLAVTDEQDALLALLPTQLRSVLPREELRAALMPEDFSDVAPGRLFMAHDAEEERLHTELRQMLLAFYDSIPVQRPQGVSHKVKPLDDSDLNGCPDNASTRVAAPARRLRGELRSAARGLAGAVAGAAASLAAADGAEWRVAAAASALLAAVSASDPGDPAAAKGEPAALLAAHAQARVSRAATVLCEARVLHAARDARLLVTQTRQAQLAREAVVEFAPPVSEVRGAERVFTNNGGKLLLTPRQRGWGGLMAVILTGATSGHLNLALSVTADVNTAQSDLAELDQFLHSSTVAISVQNAPPHGAPAIHSGKLLSTRQPLCLKLHSALFTLATRSLHLVTSAFGVAIADSQRTKPACLSVRGPLGPDGSAEAASGRKGASDPRSGVKQQLQSAAAAATIPLHTHLVAAGALPPAFVPPVSTVSDAACAAFSACMAAVRATADRAGAAGVSVTALLRAVVGDPAAAPGEDGAVAVEEREGVLRDAVRVGQALALRDGAVTGTAMLALDQTQWPAVAEGADGEEHALACSGLQAAVSALQAQDRISLKPHLGSSLSLVSTSAHPQPDSPPARSTATDPPSPRSRATKPHHALAAPWILPSGSVHWPTLRDIVWQVLCALSAFPGIPEDLLAEKLGHSLGRAHVVMLLQRLEAQGLVRCVALPMHVDCITGGTAPCADDGESVEVRPAEGLLATARGLVPAIFGGGRGAAEPRGPDAEVLRLLPLVSHYFSEVGASLDADMEKYGEHAWV